MKRSLPIALALATLVIGACNPFLTGEGLTNDPNNPTTASREALFMGVQAATWGEQESSLALTVCMWMQQCTGGGGRFVEEFGRYVIDENSHSFDFNSVYSGGGLIDIRKIEATAATDGDSIFLGIAQIYEALVIGTAADVWGDIPYTQALQGPPPALDNQFAVYDSVQALLNRAIVNLGGKGPGPLDRDLIFAGKPAPWIKVAHSMKARYFLHTVEAAAAGLLTGRTAAQVYADVLTQAGLGISDPTGAGDFAAFHGQATSERNVWFQFQQSTFGIDLVAGKFLVDILKTRNDPRLPQYFATDATDPWKLNHRYPKGSIILDTLGHAEVVTAVTGDTTSGAAQPAWPATVGATTVDDNVTWTNFGLPYGGEDVNTAQIVSTISAVGGTRISATFRQPFVSYAENELMLAEAYNKTSQDPLATTHLNNERATVPLSNVVGATGAALLDSIMTEKYVALFQNIEVWNDYRRTCLPALTPYLTANGALPAYGNKVPGRFYYGANERNTNTNIPAPSTQLGTNGFRNRNDPAACP